MEAALRWLLVLAPGSHRDVAVAEPQTHRVHNVELDAQARNVVADKLGGREDARAGTEHKNLYGKGSAQSINRTGQLSGPSTFNTHRAEAPASQTPQNAPLSTPSKLLPVCLQPRGEADPRPT